MDISNFISGFVKAAYVYREGENAGEEPRDNQSAPDLTGETIVKQNNRAGPIAEADGLGADRVY